MSCRCLESGRYRGEVSSQTETYAKELMESVTPVWVYNLDGVEIILIKIWQLQGSWN
ncbi:hypothetical protein NO108_05001 [Planktothrix rubescens]|nr:hypothetical protein NO108_05001 [Planktothrix rubescens]CAH2575575.1 hypothetical protein PRNO82_05050 [Planktothrix rubescens]